MVAIGALILLIILALLLLPKRSGQKPEPITSTLLSSVQEYAPPQPMVVKSLRETALDEDAAALANEFRKVRYQQYLDDLRASAVAAFGPSASGKKLSS